MEILLSELAGATGHDPRLDAAVKDVQQELTDLEDLEARARSIVERLALVLQGSLLVRFGDSAVADAFARQPGPGRWSGLRHAPRRGHRPHRRAPARIR